MKKKVLAFTLLTSLLAINAEGQVDQKTAIAKVPNGKEYVQFHTIDQSEDGYAGKKREKTYYLSHQNNVIDELSFLHMYYEKLNTKETKGGPGDPMVDHYTKPALIYTGRNHKGTLILDGIVYEFEDAKMEDILSGNFKIEYIYVPKKIVDSKEDNVKFLRALKVQKKTGFKLSVSKTVADIDHNKKIKEYFTAMKPIQKKATTNFTQQEKANIQKIKEIRQKQVDEINARVAQERALAAKRRKQAKGGSGSSDEVIIINETGRSVCLVQGRSSTSFTSKESFDCDEPVYWGVTTDGGRNCTSDKRGIAVSAGQCGKEVVLR